MSKFPSNIRHQDLHPQPFEHVLSPITTRSGLPPYMHIICTPFLSLSVCVFMDSPFLFLSLFHQYLSSIYIFFIFWTFISIITYLCTSISITYSLSLKTSRNQFGLSSSLISDLCNSLI